MQISGRTRSIALGTAAGVSLALSGTALAVALGGDGDQHGRDGGPPAFAGQQDGGPQGYGSQQGYESQHSAQAGPPMQSGTS